MLPLAVFFSRILKLLELDQRNERSFFSGGEKSELRIIMWDYFYNLILRDGLDTFRLIFFSLLIMSSYTRRGALEGEIQLSIIISEIRFDTSIVGPAITLLALRVKSGVENEPGQ